MPQPDFRQNHSKRDTYYRELALRHCASTLLNKSINKVEYPGGVSRESYRVIFDDKSSVIATRRDSIYKARTESHILYALGKHDCSVPKLLSTNFSQILIQEEILGTRFSKLINNADAGEYLLLMKSAVESLHVIHAAAKQETLHKSVKVLGNRREWIEEFVSSPMYVGEYLDVLTPELDVEAIVSQLKVIDKLFIKWDSRPGNALTTRDGRVIWFDWEHAGARNLLDDFAWLLCDEFVPFHPDEEQMLVDSIVEKVDSKIPFNKRKNYLYVYGTFHTLVRLGLILKFKDKDNSWWDLKMCINKDKIGVNLSCVNSLCMRGAHWANQSELTRPLTGWFFDIQSKVEKL